MKFSWIHLFFLIIVALLLRAPTFFVAHNTPDEVIYRGVSLKIRESGLKDYNLFGVENRKDPDGLISVVSLNPDVRMAGVLRSLAGPGVTYYAKESLSNMPPLWPWMLQWSQEVFAPEQADQNISTTVGYNFGWNWWKALSIDIFTGQFYATWLNVAFSLGLILLTVALGRSMMGASEGWIAGWLLAFNPVDILTSQRLWADELTAFLTAAAMLCLWRGMRIERLVWFAAAGAICGLVVLAKGSGLFVGAAIGGFLLIEGIRITMTDAQKWRSAILRLVAFGLPSALLAFTWHGLVYAHYGVWIHSPTLDDAAMKSPWFQMLANRHPLGQTFYFFFLSPLLILAYFEWIRRAAQRTWRSQETLLLLWFGITLLALLLIHGKEERYLLPAYPAICIMAASALMVIWKKLGDSRHRVWLRATAFVVFIALLAWPACVGLDIVVRLLALHPLP